MSTQHTLIGGLVSVDLDGPLRRRCGQLLLHGLLFSVVALLIPWTLGIEHPGLISVFLVAASLRDHLVMLLDENRERIWGGLMPAGEANRETSISLLALFLGTFFGYFGIALWLGASQLPATFGALLTVTPATGGSLLEVGHFGSFVGVLGHNLSVMVAIFAIAALYRAYGAVLVLSWNAAVWATVLCVLGTQAAQSSSGSGLLLFGGSAVAVMPHLTAEALGYCIAAISAIFASLAIAKYELTDPRIRSVMGSVGTLLVTAIVLLSLGAALEAHYAPGLLALLAAP